MTSPTGMSVYYNDAVEVSILETPGMGALRTLVMRDQIALVQDRGADVGTLLVLKSGHRVTAAAHFSEVRDWVLGGATAVKHGMRNPSCTVCTREGVRHEHYDAYYCAACNVWIEGKCDEPNCEYCVGRPDRPNDEPKEHEECQKAPPAEP